MSKKFQVIKFKETRGIKDTNIAKEKIINYLENVKKISRRSIKKILVLANIVFVVLSSGFMMFNHDGDVIEPFRWIDKSITIECEDEDLIEPIMLKHLHEDSISVITSDDYAGYAATFE
jgi:hypothetical protein